MTFNNDNLDEYKIAENEIETDIEQFNKYRNFCVEIVLLYSK
jgi:hypothetical protein